jgi:hypothetical protein
VEGVPAPLRVEGFGRGLEEVLGALVGQAGVTGLGVEVGRGRRAGSGAGGAVGEENRAAGAPGKELAEEARGAGAVEDPVGVPAFGARSMAGIVSSVNRRRIRAIRSC